MNDTNDAPMGLWHTVDAWTSIVARFIAIGGVLLAARGRRG